MNQNVHTARHGSSWPNKSLLDSQGSMILNKVPFGARAVEYMFKISPFFASCGKSPFDTAWAVRGRLLTAGCWLRLLQCYRRLGSTENQLVLCVCVCVCFRSVSKVYVCVNRESKSRWRHCMSHSTARSVTCLNLGVHFFYFFLKDETNLQKDKETFWFGFIFGDGHTKVL